jgi:hypothetical protein
MPNHVTNLTDIHQRLLKLERQNRLFKRMIGLFLIVTCAVFVMGQKPDQARTVEVERFVLLDANGKAHMASASSNYPTTP